MIYIQLRPGEASDSSPHASYRIAGQDVVIDQPIHQLTSYENLVQKRLPEEASRPPFLLPGGGRRIYGGQGWVGNRWRQVACDASGSGYRISIDGIGVFEVSPGGDRVCLTERVPEAAGALLIEAVLGPALILALAQQGVYCLHASAVSGQGQHLLFLGESGAGKSTLARWLAAKPREMWRRIGDDIFPVMAGRTGIMGLPAFPQLKIDANAQPAQGLPEQLALDAIYVVRRPRDGERVALRELRHQEGALALLRHSVAARLFDTEQMSRHFDFCAWASGQTPMRELVYPLQEGALPAVEAALRQDLERLAQGQGAPAGRSEG